MDYKFDKFEGADFKCDNRFLKFYPPPPPLPPKRKQIRQFWSQIEAFPFFHKILQLDKFESADFKYNNIIFKFLPKNT